MALPHDCEYDARAYSTFRTSAAATPSTPSRGGSRRHRVVALVALVAAVARGPSVAEAQTPDHAKYTVQLGHDWANGGGGGGEAARTLPGDGAGRDVDSTGFGEHDREVTLDEQADDANAEETDQRWSHADDGGLGDGDKQLHGRTEPDSPELSELQPLDLDGPPMALLTATTPAHLSPDDTELITVPEGAEEGDLIEIETEDGDRYFATVPSDVAWGETFEVYTHTLETEDSLVGLEHDEEDMEELHEFRQYGSRVLYDDDAIGDDYSRVEPGSELATDAEAQVDDGYDYGDDWEGEEAFGGGGYDDAYAEFYNDTDRRHYGPGLHTVWFARARMLIARHLYATNCIQVGGGKVPYYEYCEGCSAIEAQRCISDMRSNISKNVPYGCDFNTNTQKRQPQCCATFGDNNHFHSLQGESAAYNDALLCLNNIGCRDSAFYHQIEDECHFNGCDVVPVFQEDDMEVWDDDVPSVDDNTFHEAYREYDDDVTLLSKMEENGNPDSRVNDGWFVAKYFLDDDMVRRNPGKKRDGDVDYRGRNKGRGDTKKHKESGQWLFIRDNKEEEAGTPRTGNRDTQWASNHKKYRDKEWELRPSEWKQAWGKQKWFDTTDVTSSHDLKYYLAADQKMVRHRRYPKALRPGQQRPYTWVKHYYKSVDDEYEASFKGRGRKGEWGWRKVWRWKKYGDKMVDACMVADREKGYEMFRFTSPGMNTDKEKKKNPRNSAPIKGKRSNGRRERYWSRKLNDDDYASTNRFETRGYGKKQTSRGDDIHKGLNKYNIWREPARCTACQPTDRSAARGAFSGVAMGVLVSVVTAVALGFEIAL